MKSDTSPLNMGANQSESKSEGDLPPCGLLPQCVDCSPICEPKSSMPTENKTGKKMSTKTKPSVSQFNSFHNPDVECRHSERRNSNVVGEVESAASSPRFEIKHSIHSGELPADWSMGQQKQLQKAVEEVSLRSKVRIPRIRVMQELVAARADGAWKVNTSYDLR